jgi:hypothetical protein
VLQTFNDLCSYLAHDGGGFTLWVGAGAAIAASAGRSPGWQALVDSIASSAGIPAPAGEGNDYPSRLELLSSAVEHARFRKELRIRLMTNVPATSVDIDNAMHQATIATRAGALVSFNIDLVSGFLLSLLGGGTTFVPRTLRERSDFAINITASTNPGTVGKPVYFPHGLLLEGNVVITRSEYDRHVGSLAMTTAVHLCIGTDLVIVGTSLDDRYLRDAVLPTCARSWNLQDVIYRDVGLQFRSPAVANLIIEYLAGLIAQAK